MPYEGLAAIYDRLMGEDIQYPALCDFIETLFLHYHKTPHLIVDLACGTGSVTQEMTRRGYDMIGVDTSAEMLAAARQKDSTSLYLEQSLTDFELYGTVDAALCMIDGYTYLTSDEEINSSFSLVRNYLNPDGLFLFDISTEYKFSQLLADQTFVCDEGDIFYTWENHYEPPISTADITFFVEDKGLYRRFEEHHRQRAHNIAHLTELLTQLGFYQITVCDEQGRPPKADCDRIFIASLIKK